MPEPEKVDASSQPFATGVQQHSYKALLNQHLQKLKKQAAVYQTQNEGSGHQPKFRSTVWVDGVSYTSPNTFQHRKLAEMDASRITLSALILNLKNEAIHHVHQDIRSCKSILVEYAVRMNVQMPTYETVKTGPQSLFFRSSLVFNGVSYTGDDCRAKKEAEQSAARAAILKCLDSETGYLLSEIIKSKFNHLVTKETPQSAQNDTNEVAKGTAIPSYTDHPLQITTTTTPPATAINPAENITQTHTFTTTPQINSLSTPPTTTTTLQINPPVHVPQTHVAPTHTIPMPMPMVLGQTPLTQSTEANSAPASVSPPPVHLTQTRGPQMPTVPTPHTHLSNVVQHEVATTSIPVVTQSTQGPTPTVSSIMPTALLAQTPVSATTTPSPRVSGKKRNRKNKKNSQKRMRTAAQNQLVMAAMYQGQIPTFSAQ